MTWASGIRTRLMVSSSAHSPGIPYTPSITLLTVSSRVAFIFCFAFPTTLQCPTPASTSNFDEHSRAAKRSTLYRSYRTSNTLALARYTHYNTRSRFPRLSSLSPATPSFACRTLREPAPRRHLTLLSKLIIRLASETVVRTVCCKHRKYCSEVDVRLTFR